jgi:hypothetical protein
LAIVVLFGTTAVLAGEREVPRAETKIVYNDDFPPPHVVVGQILEEIREEWLVQELDTLASKQEETDEE